MVFERRLVVRPRYNNKPTILAASIVLTVSSPSPPASLLKLLQNISSNVTIVVSHPTSLEMNLTYQSLVRVKV